RLIALVAVLALVALALSACGMLRGVKKPAADQFGVGPRQSAQSRYTATLELSQPLKARRMMTLQVSLRDAAGNPVDGAQIEIDGGMPQHGHGLPTKPRVTKNHGDGGTTSKASASTWAAGGSSVSPCNRPPAPTA
ncbi:MAG TPA: FixH family protein, partial [Thermoanaerobaculia bacterium]